MLRPVIQALNKCKRYKDMHGKANLRFRIVVILGEKEGNMVREVRGSQGSTVKKKGCNYLLIKEKQLLKDAVHNERVRSCHCNFTLKFSSIALSTLYFLITCFLFFMFITAIL